MPRSLLVLSNAFWFGFVLAQVAVCQPAVQNLTEYQGQYEYRDGGSLVIVATGDRLVAIIGEGKYPLQPVGTDAFRNVVGDRIPFLRDSNGRVTAFKERGAIFKRLSSSVPAAARLLLEPGPTSTAGGLRITTRNPRNFRMVFARLSRNRERCGGA